MPMQHTAMLLLPLGAVAGSYTGPVADGHVHLTNVSRVTYAWQPECSANWAAGVCNCSHTTAHAGVAAPQYSPACNWDLAAFALASADAQQHSAPVRAVFVEVYAADASRPDEAEWAAGIDPVPGAAVAAVCGRTPEIFGCGDASVDEAALDALGAAGPLLRGVRPDVLDGKVPDPGSPCRTAHQDEDVAVIAAALARIGSRGLVADLEFSKSYGRNVAIVAGALQREPSMRFVVDHCMSPPLHNTTTRAEHLDAWRGNLSALAALNVGRNDSSGVYVKMSGMPHAWGPAGSWRPSDLLPLMRTVLDTMGAGRVLFAGNWAVDIHATEGDGPTFPDHGRKAYKAWFDVVQELVVDASEADQHDVFYRTAARAYAFA